MTADPGRPTPDGQAAQLAAARPSGRRRASHSLEAVLDGAVSLLDDAGESGLTFRALAARLGGGVGSVYWYVSSKDELLDKAADHVIYQLLAEADPAASTDPIDDVRRDALALYTAVDARPWLGRYFLRNSSVQPNALRYYERVGQSMLRLGLAPREAFHAASAVIGFVIGIAADVSQQPTEAMLAGEVRRDEYLEQIGEQWRALDPDAWPFLHAIADEFAEHDDADQFRAGLDLLLAGLRLQAQGR